MELAKLVINLVIKIFGQDVFWQVIKERQEYKNEINRIVFEETKEIRNQNQEQKLIKEVFKTEKKEKRILNRSERKKLSTKERLEKVRKEKELKNN